jgi:amino acid transporter
MITDPEAGPSTSISRSLASNRLGILAIACFVLSAAAPVTVVAGIIPTGFAATGIIGIPLAFLAIGAVLALFSVGFNAMSRRISNAGAFYAYVSQGLGKPIGVACAVMAAFAYNLLQVGLYGIFGIAVAPLLNPVFAADVPWWAYALGAWVVVAILGWRRVDLNGRILAVLMGAEIVLVLVYNAANLAHPAGGSAGLDVSGFEPANLFVPGVGALFVIAITGFVGFEASAIFSEEAKDRTRTVPRATYLCIGVIAVLYSLSAWAMSVTTGPDKIAEVSGANGGETIFVLAATNLGTAWADIGHVLFATSVFAAMVSYHNAVGRYMFSLGREGVLPSVFGSTTRAGAPKWGSVFQSGIGILFIIGYAIGGLDPLVQLFFWGGTTGGFGVLILLTITSVAVIGYHLRNRGETAWRGIIAPGAALIALLFIVWTAASNFDVLLGVPADSPLRWIFPGSYIVLTVIGLAWAGVIRQTKPSTYRTIGLGANSATGRTSIVVDHPGAHELGEPR